MLTRNFYHTDVRAIIGLYWNFNMPNVKVYGFLATRNKIFSAALRSAASDMPCAVISAVFPVKENFDGFMQSSRIR